MNTSAQPDTVPAKQALHGDKPYRCHHCNTAVGFVRANVLYVGKVHFVEFVRMKCTYCSHSMRWKPAPHVDTPQPIG